MTKSTIVIKRWCQTVEIVFCAKRLASPKGRGKWFFDTLIRRTKSFGFFAPRWECGRALTNKVASEVMPMLSAAWLMLSTLLYSLQLSTGSFPKPLTAQEERLYLERAAQGDLEARNILIQRNLRLVAHIMNKG